MKVIRHLHPPLFPASSRSPNFLLASHLTVPLPLIYQTTTTKRNPGRTHLLTPDESLMSPPSPSIQHAVDRRVLFSVRGGEVTLSSLILGRGERGVAVQRWGGDDCCHLQRVLVFVCLSIVCEGLGKMVRRRRSRSRSRYDEADRPLDCYIARCYVKKVDSESKVTSSGFLAFLPNIFG
jgi:hypothetical protein